MHYQTLYIFIKLYFYRYIYYYLFICKVVLGSCRQQTNFTIVAKGSIIVVSIRVFCKGSNLAIFPRVEKQRKTKKFIFHYLSLAFGYLLLLPHTFFFLFFCLFTLLFSVAFSFPYKYKTNKSQEKYIHGTLSHYFYVSI